MYVYACAWIFIAMFVTVLYLQGPMGYPGARGPQGQHVSDASAVWYVSYEVYFSA